MCLDDAAAEFAAGNYQMAATRKREQLRDLFDLDGLTMAGALVEIDPEVLRRAAKLAAMFEVRDTHDALNRYAAILDGSTAEEQP